MKNSQKYCFYPVYNATDFLIQNYFVAVRTFNFVERNSFKSSSVQKVSKIHNVQI